MKFISPQELGSIIPELILVATLIVGIVLDLIVRDQDRKAVAVISLLGLVGAFFADLYAIAEPAHSMFSGMLIRDEFAVALQVVALMAAALTILISAWTAEVSQQLTAGKGEYYLMIIGATIGMFFLLGSTNLLMLYLSMELLSLPSYLLVGWLKRSRRSTEAGIKYIVYGAGASCSMIYGISLLYGLSGSLQLSGINDYLIRLAAQPDLPKSTFVLALIFTLAGFFFKIAAFPLFQWAPDVYEGAPTPITAFLAVGSKAVGMGAMVRFLFFGMASRVTEDLFAALGVMNWPLFIAIISALTMTVGNFVALAQTNAKRMLAYSSIAHAGYILMGIPVLSVLGIQAILFYLLVYLIMNLGAFLSVIVLENRGISPDMKNYTGLGARAPSVAVAFSVFLFSLTGIPPLAGFIGKVYLFAALIKGGIYWLAVIGVLNSVVSLYYYAGVVKRMFFDRAADETHIESVPVLRVVLWILVIPTVFLGIYWKPVMDIAHTAASTFGL